MRSVALCLTIASLLPGCTFWHNFTTYFNTLYLARTHVQAYEYSLLQPAAISTNSAIAVQNHRWLDEEFITRELAQREGRTLAVQPTFSRSLSAGKPITNVHLDSAIILGSKILANKKETKYIEDALFIVGKALYYKNDFGSARRKFLELLTRYPDTRFAAEASNLLARSMVATRLVDSASTVLAIGERQALASGDKQLLGELHRTTAEYIYTKNPDSLAAIADQLRAAEDGLSGTELSRLAYEEGAIDFFNSNWPEAERAFQRSADAAKDDWQEGESKMAHATALRREGKFKEAESEFNILSTRAKYVSSQAAARYELAYTADLAARAASSGDLRTAEFRNNYAPHIISDYYTLDTSYRNSSIQILSRAKFRSAELYREMGEYDSASRYTVNLIGTKDFSSTAMNDLVSNRMRALSKFSYWRAEIKKSDSLVHIVRGNRAVTNPQAEAAQLHTRALQEALGARYNPAAPVALSGEDSLRISQIEAKLKREKTMMPQMAVSDTAHYVDSMRYHAATAHFEIGHAYEAFNEDNQARLSYDTVLAYRYHADDTVKIALRAQALYALLQLETRDHNKLAADSVLHLLLGTYGQTIYAEQARQLFGTVDQNSRGELAYSGAYQFLKANGLDRAKPLLLDVVGNYHSEDVAPRALYALGLSYEETSRFDSAVAYYRWILREYPFSQYARAIRPRLADASASVVPAGRVDPMDTRSSDQKQMEEVEKARKARAEQMKKEMQASPPGLPSTENPDPTQNSQPTQTGQPTNAQAPPQGGMLPVPPQPPPPGFQPPIQPRADGDPLPRTKK